MAQLVDKAKGFVADKVARVEKPEAELAELSFQSVGRGGATLAGRVDVRNPYSHSIPICEVSYSLKSAGREVASGTMPDPGSLTAGDTTRLDIPVKVPYDFLVSLARDAGRDWDIDYEMRVGLTVDLPILGNFTLPLTKSGELKPPNRRSNRKLQKAAAVSMQKENMMILKRNSHLQPHAKQNKLPQLASNIW